jgi:hypothetical protein
MPDGQMRARHRSNASFSTCCHRALDHGKRCLSNTNNPEYSTHSRCANRCLEFRFTVGLVTHEFSNPQPGNVGQHQRQGFLEMHAFLAHDSRQPESRKPSSIFMRLKYVAMSASGSRLPITHSGESCSGCHTPARFTRTDPLQDTPSSCTDSPRNRNYSTGRSPRPFGLTGS